LTTPPKEKITKKYSTRTNSQGIIDLVLEHEIYYRRRKYRLKIREINNQLALGSMQDIRILFVDNSIFLNPNQMDAPCLIDCYKPFDFFNIVCYPHDFPSSLENTPLFHGDNGIGAIEHWDDFMDFVISLSIEHIDVFYKRFSL